jgi:hypothetical protein
MTLVNSEGVYGRLEDGLRRGRSMPLPQKSWKTLDFGREQQQPSEPRDDGMGGTSEGGL